MVFSYDYGKQKKGATKNKSTSVAGHFDDHVSALEEYRWHCLMRHVQGYRGSHWTPPLGAYLLLIAPAAARATANKMATKNESTLVDILMAAAVRRYHNLHIA